VLTASPSFADPRLVDVAARAHALRLSEDPEWLRLIHYGTGFLGSTDSEVERGEFFLSPRGRTDHEAELVATLAAFLAPVLPGQEDAHALCRFPARREWLDRQLRFLGGRRPVRCPRLDAALARVGATGVHFVYASAYLGNPASAFGHAFLHLTTRAGDQAPPSSQKRDTQDLGIEYRALTTTTNPILYAVEGVAGLFAGYMEGRTYDEQARTYTAEQGRDLWEYDLALSRDEITFLLLHLWELRGARINYFYLTRNCAFEVLLLLETAAPRLELVQNVKMLVLPIDALKAVATVPGLVKDLGYRPSLETRLHARIARLTTSEQIQVQRLMDDPSAPWPAAMPPARRQLVLDAAIFELEAHASKDLEKDAMTPAKRRWQVLVARRHGVVLPEAPLKPDWDVRPDWAHDAMRVNLGTGATTQYGDGYGAIGYRLALHDLTDAPDGWPELAQVVVFDTELRYAWQERRLTLDKLTFIDVLGLNPISPAEPRASFRIQAFGVRLHDRACPDCFAHGADGSIGITLASRDQRLAFFAMADAYVAFLPHLTGLANSFVRVGAGPFGGLRVRVGETVAVLTATLSYLPFERIATTYQAQLAVKRALRKNVALGIEAVAQPLSFEAQFSSYVYF
jgi:hypothetical protein